MERIKQKVDRLIEDMGSADPFFICEKRGIIVLDQDLPDSINGFTITMDGIRFIVLNKNLDYYCRKITAAHELGHIILHGSTNTIKLSLNTEFCISKYEREADCFAAHLLLAAELQELQFMESVTCDDISRITHIPKSMIESAFFD